ATEGLVEPGLREDAAAVVVELAHHVGVAVEPRREGLLHQELLVDGRFQRTRLRLRGLRRPADAAVLERRLHARERDLAAVHARRDVAHAARFLAGAR